MFCWEGILWRSLPAFHVFNLISEFQVLPDWNSQEELGLEGMAAPLTNSPSNQLHFVTDATYPLILLHHQQQFYFQKVAGKKNHQSWRYMVRSSLVCGSQCLTKKWNLGKFVISSGNVRFYISSLEFSPIGITGPPLSSISLCWDEIACFCFESLSTVMLRCQFNSALWTSSMFETPLLNQCIF